MNVTKSDVSPKAHLLLIASLFWMSQVGPSHAHSSVALSGARPLETSYASWNWPTQKIADASAVAGCRETARKNGLAKFVSSCRVIHRQKEPGAGAIVCGNDGCSISSGHSTRQQATDRAYDQCRHHGFADCRDTGITDWWDETGYAKTPLHKGSTVRTCGPPPGKTVRSRYQCSNGDCTRTFENGCTVRFQAPYCHDPVSGRWEWKPDGCQ